MKFALTLICALAIASCASFQPLTTADAVDLAATSALVLQKDTAKRAALADKYVKAGDVLIALSGTASREEITAAVQQAVGSDNPEAVLIVNLVLRFYQPGNATGAGMTAKQIGDALKRVGQSVNPPLPKA